MKSFLYMMVLGICCGGVGAFSVTGAAVSDGDADAKEIRIPYSDADGLKALDELGALFGVYDVPAEGQTSAEQLREMVARLGEGVELRETPQGAVIVVKKYTIRRHTRQWRASFRDWLRESFPNSASKIDARYGLRRWVKSASGDIETERFSVTDSAASKEAENLGQVVLLVHGLDEPGMVWASLAPALIDAGYQPLEFMYPNDQPIADSTRRLAEALRELKGQGVDRVAIVAHSMGGLVARDCLTHPELMNGHGSGLEAYPAITNLITVGTPNQGSQMARLRFVCEIRDQTVQTFNGNNPLLSSFLDGGAEALGDLLPDSPYLTELNSRELPQDVRITVIAGRASPVSVDGLRDFKSRMTAFLPDGWVSDQPAAFWSHLINGVGDGAVTLAATRLAGVSDHVTVNGDHVNMLRDYLRRKSFEPPAIPIILDRLDQNKDRP